MKTKPTIILDFGHGGWNPIRQKYMTKGKRSLTPIDGEWFYEGVNNRKVGETIIPMLEAKGYNVVCTVLPSDFRDISLKQRVEFENHLFDKDKGNTLFISIHSNGHSNDQAHGHEVFTSPGTTKSDVLATYWMETMEEVLPGLKRRPDWSDGDADKEAYFYVLTETYSPAILIELGFHTNQEDVRMMRKPNFNKTIGEILIKTIEKYIANS